MLLISLVGCGDSNDSDGSRFKNSGTSNTREVTQNVAFVSNGASIKSATYDQEGAKYIIDGNISTSNYWAGNTSNESVVIEFEKTAKTTRIEVVTNATTYNLTNPAIVLELSTNNRTWRSFMAATNDGGIQCNEWELSSNVLSCTLSNESARYLRLKTNSNKINIYEVTVIGKVSV